MDEIIQAVPEVQAEVAPVEVQDATPPVEETAAPTDEQAKPEVKTEKTFTQAELDDILQRRLAKESRKIERLSRAEAENQFLRQQIEQRQPQQQVSPSGEPKPENFDTYEKYIDSLTDWKVDQKLKGLQEQTAQTKKAETQQAYDAKIRENLSKAATKYDDFEEVVSNPSLPITVPMRDAIGESELGGEIAYYLGNHLTEAAEIAKMSPVQQIRALDKIEAKLVAPPKPSNAPKPIEAVKGGGAPSGMPNPSDTKAYIAWANKQERFGT